MAKHTNHVSQSRVMALFEIKRRALCMYINLHSLTEKTSSIMPIPASKLLGIE